jgi:hypothetical protein
MKMLEPLDTDNAERIIRKIRFIPGRTFQIDEPPACGIVMSGRRTARLMLRFFPCQPTSSRLTFLPAAASAFLK